MNLYINQNKIFILGAGASIDFGLPVWKDLTPLIKNYLNDIETSLSIQYKDEILEWLDLIDHKYGTIDECIFHQTSSEKYKENGQEIEFEIFRILEQIFSKLYRPNFNSWIRNLNEKIRKSSGINLNDIFFINYNYDSVLSDNILDFSYMSKTERERVYREEIESLKREIFTENNKIPCLCPHGIFKRKINRGYLSENIHTVNSHDNKIPQSVSCYHSKKHKIVFEDPTEGVNLYILGLGAGLPINLNNIIFENNSDISNIYVTVREDNKASKEANKKKREGVINFLVNQYKLQKENIHVFNDCIELIEKCFPDN